MTRVVVQGRSALAQLLRLLADQIDDGSIIYPPSVQPAPHLGPYAVRVGGIDYDLSVGLPGMSVDVEEEEEQTPATEPGKGPR